jgi:outer membrane protein assembly factor BamB
MRGCTTLTLVGIAFLGAVAAPRALPAQQEGTGAAAATARIAWKHAPAGCSFEDLVTDGRVLIVLDRSGRIDALDPASGEVKWSSKEKLDFGRGYGVALSPAADFDAVLVGCDTGLVALRRDNGQRLWRTDIAGGVAGPACTERAVFAGGSDGRIHACDLRTGKELWSDDCMADRPDDPPGFAGAQARFEGCAARMGAAQTDGRRVVVPIFDQCRAVAVDAQSGKRLWAFRTEGWTYGGVAIGEHNTFVVSQDEHLYAVDKELGKEMWRVATKDRNEAPATPAGRFAYVGSCDGNLYAVDEVVGRVVWQFPIEPDARGNTPIYGSPLVLGDAVVLAAMPGVVYSVDRKDGRLRWKVRPSPGSELNGDLVAIGNRLFVTTRTDGKAGESGVFAIDPP